MSPNTHLVCRGSWTCKSRVIGLEISISTTPSVLHVEYAINYGSAEPLQNPRAYRWTHDDTGSNETPDNDFFFVLKVRLPSRPPSVRLVPATAMSHSVKLLGRRKTSVWCIRVRIFYRSLYFLHCWTVERQVSGQLLDCRYVS